MRLLGLDFETTGFNTGTDRAIEMGVCLWDTERRAPIEFGGVYIVDDGIRELMRKPEVSDMCKRVSGIRLEDLEEFGMPPVKALKTLLDYTRDHHVDYIVAHNGENYDKPLLLAELHRHGLSAEGLPEWIDTRFDIPFPTEPDSRKLKHLALDCGFINPFAHRAATDVLTMMRVLDHYPLDQVLEYRKIPFITVRAVVEYAEREKAKAQRYSWERLGEKVYLKRWVKRIKANLLEDERKRCDFEVRVIPEEPNVQQS
jgi:DNA polymerase-3 subunit epsilon